MASNDQLVRYLSCADTFTDENTEYYLHTAAGSLTEKTYDGAEYSLPTQIAKTKPNGPAAYLCGETTRVAFYIDTDGKLGNSIYNADEDSWEQGKVSEANIRPHPDSKLSAIFGQGKPHIYFQCAEGKLEEYSSEDGIKWSSGGHLSSNAKPIQGTALKSIPVGDDQICLFYQHESGSIHYLVKDLKTGQWADKKLNNGEVQGNATGIIASDPSGKGEFDVYYVTNEGKLNYISPEKKTELGTIDPQGNFKASTSAECFFIIPIFIPPRPRKHHHHHCHCGW